MSICGNGKDLHKGLICCWFYREIVIYVRIIDKLKKTDVQYIFASNVALYN